MAYEPRQTARPGYEPRDAKYHDPMRVGRRQTPSEIEAEIEATRRRIEDRLNTIQGETAPSRLLERGLGTDLSSPLDTANVLMERAKQNPLGAGLIAAGLAALYFGRNERPVVHREPAYDAEVPGPATRDAAERVAYDIAALKGHANAIAEDTRATKARLSSQVSSATGSFRSDAQRTGRDVSDAYVDAKMKAMSAAEQAKFKAMSAAERAKLKAQWAYESASETVSDWADDAREAVSRAPTVVRERADYAGRWVQENPVTAGLIGLALGAAAASVFAAGRSKAPRSRAQATRELYRSSNGYETSEYLQAQATRRKAGAGTTTARSGSTGTKAKAVKAAANPARSTANQMARRAPATAKGTTGKSVSTDDASTVKKASSSKTSGKPKTAKKPSRTKSASASSTKRTSAASTASRATPKVKSASTAAKPSTNGTAKTYSAAAPASTTSPSTSGRPASSDAPKPN